MNKWTITQLIQWTTEFFQKKGIDTPRLDAEILLAYTLGVDRLFLYVNFDKPLELDELARYRDVVRRRGQREPIAYIKQTKEFYSLDFYINNSVLIPRPETELLVDYGIKALKEMTDKNHPPRLLDIGTGSGAVLLSIGYHIKECHLSGTEIDRQAMHVTQENANNLGLADRIQLFCCDLFPPVSSSQLNRYDLVVSNPPYIPSDEIDTLQPEIALYEPKISLDGGIEGVSFYRRIIDGACEKMVKNGIILLEIGDNQAGIVTKLFEDHGKFSEIESYQDLSGIIRIMKAKKMKESEG